MTPDDREAARQATNRLAASINWLESRMEFLSQSIANREKEETEKTIFDVNRDAAEAIRATHAVCDRLSELAAIHRR